MVADALSEMRERIEQVRSRIADAAARSGRSERDVTLVGVTKFQPLDALYRARDLGIDIFGENRVQERAEKASAWSGPDVEWQMIGRLQRNKVRRAVELFSCIQSIDSPALADTVERTASELGRAPFKVMVEVNTSGEESKAGVGPSECSALVDRIVERCPSLELIGMMTIGPLDGSEAEVRAAFASLRELRESERRRTGLALPLLSMGMSGDFEWAIEEGSTMVRVGTSIFGARETR